MQAITDSGTDTLRQMTAEQLLQLGGRHVVYLKAAMRGGKQTFILYGANGATLMAFDTIEEAVERVDAHGLSFAAVH
jgi:hypothetical protein